MRGFRTLRMVLVILASATLIHAACGNSQETPEAEPNPHPAIGSNGQEARPTLVGTVVETMNSGGYTYVKLEKDGRETWVAVREMEVTVGEEMAFHDGGVMRDFTSKTLDRTFDSIVFSPGPVGQPGNPAHSTLRSRPAAEPDLEDIQVEKAEGPDAYTVGELYEKSADLDTRTVAVRGAVVKVSPRIMGTNWVHIRDGSGDASAGSHDLVVTTDDLPVVGETITVRGTLARDKDFGAGYRYAVIVENATVKK